VVPFLLSVISHMITGPHKMCFMTNFCFLRQTVVHLVVEGSMPATWIFFLVYLVGTEVVASPGNFACSRRIVVGEPVMVSPFQESNAGTITLDSIPCNGNLTTGVTYKPMPMGLGASTRYLIDVSTASGEPFPGANFTQGFHVYGGKTMKESGVVGNLTAWAAYGNVTRLNAGTPQNCPARTSDYANSRLIFSTAGQVVVRMAWSNNPADGVMVSPSCRYNVRSASIPATTPNTAASDMQGFTLQLYILAFSVAQCLAFSMM
jgi:hypothetical protein